jgi:ABC-type sugar transport system ATPase subunit
MIISHRLTELATHSDRVAVIIDGRCVRLLEGEDRTAEKIAETLVQGLDSPARRAAATGSGAGAVAGASAPGRGLELVRLSDQKKAFQDLDLVLPQRTVTALVGVEGSGAREIVRACGGLRSVQGKILVNGRAVPVSRLRSSVSYLAADRAASLFSNLTVGENLVIRLDNEISRGALGLRRRQMRAIGQQLSSEFQVRSASIDAGIRSLSGGNQQKVAIAAAVGSKPQVLALEEPTRGVDISSKAEIYEILRRFAARGGTVLIFCTEIPEVYEAADRLHVVSDGRPSPALDISDFYDMESLAKAVASLEAHARVEAAEAPPGQD